MRPYLPVIAVGAALVALASCGKNTDVDPTIRIVSPLPDTVLDSTSLLVAIEIEGFQLSPLVYDPPAQPWDSTPAKPFQGHWHLYLRAPGEGAFQFMDDQFGTEVWLPGLVPGIHEIVAELVNENHIPVYSTPLAYVAVEVAANANSLTIVSPGNGDFNFSSSVGVGVQIDNFTLDSAAAGQLNVADQGHWHLVVGSAFTASTSFEGLDTSAIATDLSTVGASSSYLSIWAVLANNDHTLVDPPVFDEVALLVPANSPRIHLTSPAPGATVGSSFDAYVDVANFALVDPAAAVADSAGQGHWHLLVDGVDQDIHAVSTSELGLAIGGGTHDVRVELRSNLHNPLAPSVIDVSRVTN